MYVKLYPSLWDGSLASDSFDVWALFLFMLAHADPEGFIEMTAEAISRRSGIPLDLVTAGLAKLEAPDPRSRSSEYGGARLEPIDDRGWGWQIVNYVRYRNLKTEAERRERNRAKQARRRARRLEAGAPAVVVHGHTARRSPGVAPPAPGVAPAYPQSEGDGTADADTPPPPTRAERSPNGAAPRVSRKAALKGEHPDFAEWYAAYPRHEAPIAAARAYRQALKKAQASVLLNGARRYAREVVGRDPQMVKHPTTWLNGGCWLDESPRIQPATGGAVSRIRARLGEAP